jgi:hypothetical protein
VAVRIPLFIADYALVNFNPSVLPDIYNCRYEIAAGAEEWLFRTML